MPITGLKYNNVMVEMANLNMQALPDNDEQEPFASTLTTVSAMGGGNIDKQVLVEGGEAKAPINSLAQQNSSEKFINAQVALPPLTLADKATLDLASLKNIDIYKLEGIFPQFKYGLGPQGLYGHRPEIVALTDFQPIYEEGAGLVLNSVGEMLDLQIESRRLRIDKIKLLLDTLNSTKDAENIMNELKDEYIENINKAREDVDFLVSMLQKTNAAKKALDFRNISAVSVQLISTFQTRNYKQIFVEELGFSEQGYNEFSNTKVFGQFLFDFQTIARQYSPSLLDIYDNDRAEDKDPITFAKEIDVKDGKFKFKIEKFIKQTTTATNLANTSIFTKLISDLPNNSDDRAKILLLSLSKELRVSDSLGDQSVNNILINTFNSSNIAVGNVFDDVIGKPGDLITDDPVGLSSLCSLMLITTEDALVLPFEKAYITADNNRIFHPGSRYLIDGITSKLPLFDVTQLHEYKNKFKKLTTDARTLFNKIFNLKDSKRTLFVDSLFSLVMSDCASIMEMTGEASQKDILFTVALLKAANSDNQLKSMLFQLMLLMGLKGNYTNAGVIEPNEFFIRLAEKELTTFSKFSELEGLDNIDNQPVFGPDSSTLDSLAVGSAYLALRDKIVNRLLLTINGGQSDLQNDLPSVFFTGDSIKDLLVTNGKLVFQMMIWFLQSIENATKSDNGYVLENNGRTRYNRLTPSAIAAFVFETYSSLFTKYIKTNLTATEATGESIILKIDSQSIIEVLKAIKNNLGIISNSINILDALDSEGGLQLQAPKLPGPFKQAGGGGNNEPEIVFPLIPLIFNFQGSSTPASDNKPLIDALVEMRNKLGHEDDLLKEFVERLSKTSDLIVETFEDLDKFFDSNGTNITKLNELADQEDGADKFAFFSEAQILLSQKALADLEEVDALSLMTSTTNKKKGFELKEVVKNIVAKTVNTAKKSILPKTMDVPAFFDDSEISQEIQTMLFLILNNEKYRFEEGHNLKILSVGLPAGFLSYLYSTLASTSTDFDSANNKEKDVISINVYRRDVEFEDIIFKPQSFVFEMSRFVSRSTFDNNADVLTKSNFDVILDSYIFMKDFSEFVKGQYSTGDSFFEDSKYDFLSKTEKENLVENHITSFLLSVYVQLLTGVSLDENSYFFNPEVHAGNIDDGTKDKFVKLIELYVSGIAGTTLTIEQLKNSSPQIKQLMNKIDNFVKSNNLTKQINAPILPGVSKSAAVELTEDLLSFVKTFHPYSILTGGAAHRTRVTSPKMFERIFNIPIDPDDFEVDVKKTLLTKPGTLAFDALVSQGYIIEKSKRPKVIKGKKFIVKNPNKAFYIKPRNQNRDITFDEFFITISTVGDFVT